MERHFTSPVLQLSPSSPIISFAQFYSAVFADGPTKATQTALDKLQMAPQKPLRQP